jgi:hypothetical protein
MVDPTDPAGGHKPTGKAPPPPPDKKAFQGHYQQPFPGSTPFTQKQIDLFQKQLCASINKEIQRENSTWTKTWDQIKEDEGNN